MRWIQFFLINWYTHIYEACFNWYTWVLLSKKFWISCVEYNFLFLSTNFMLDINLDFDISSHHGTIFFHMNFFNVETFFFISASSTWSPFMIFYYQPYNFLPTTTLQRYVFFIKLNRFCVFVLSFVNLISLIFIQFICL